MTPPKNRFTLADDGTLDTVVRCALCGAEVRYNYDPCDDPDDRELTDEYDVFITECLEDADADHVCEPADSD